MAQTQKQTKHRKFLLVLPVLAFPFVTLIFWSMGGGKGNEANANPLPLGLNAELPGASNKDEPLDKMGFYSLAEKDSLEREKQLKNDPYAQAAPVQIKEDYLQERYSASGANGNYSSRPIAGNYGGELYGDRNEAKVYEKLNKLQDALQQPEETRTPVVKRTEANQDYGMGGDIDRLEQMMKMMGGNNNEEDPEMKQINGMLQSILDIQHPERVQEKLRQTSAAHIGSVYAVSVGENPSPVGLLDNRPTGVTTEQNGFYNLDEIVQDSQTGNAAIPAVIHETQSCVNGSTVKLRLTRDVYINGQLIPKDQLVYGVANLNGDRLGITISNLRHDNSLFPVQLSVHDMDGLPGISIPGAIIRDATKQGGERAIQGLGMTTFDPSLGAQAASAGIEITRNIMSRKVKLVRVQITAGHKVLLLDEKQKLNK